MKLKDKVVVITGGATAIGHDRSLRPHRGRIVDGNVATAGTAVGDDIRRCPQAP